MAQTVVSPPLGKCEKQPFFLIIKKKSQNILLLWVFVAVLGLSLVAASWGSTLAAVLRLLIAVTSLVAKHKLQSTLASVVVARGL